MDWKECNIKKLVKEIEIDNNLIESLILESSKKLETNKLIILNNITSSTKISIVYDSLRGILEAISIKKGYKIYNHECYSSFLREICNKGDLANKFDKFRKIRNKINYYGETINMNEAEVLIKDMASLIKELNKELL